MRVLAHDPYADDAPCGFEEALRAADVISLHAPLTAETAGLISEAALRLVKPGAVLINCVAAGCSTWTPPTPRCWTAAVRRRPRRLRPERPDDHPLFHHPDVVLTPHVMALSRRARALVFEEMAAGMDDVLSGRRAAAVANPHVYDAARTP